MEVAPLFGAGPLEAVVLDAPPGAASALKMAYAGWNKGSQALLAAIRAFAIAESVDAALLAEWKSPGRTSPQAQSARSTTTRRRPGASSARWRRSPGRSPRWGCPRPS